MKQYPLGKSLKLLVLEPDHDSRVELRRALESAGHVITSATNGADALALIEKVGLPDAILLSGGVPWAAASQFLALLRALPGSPQIPFVELLRVGEQRLPGAHKMVRMPLREDGRELLEVIAGLNIP